MSKRYKVKRFSSCYLMNWVDNTTNKELTALEIEEILHKQEKRIAELKKQLEEKGKMIQMQQSIERYDIGEMLTENVKLKQQLHSQPAEIVEKIKEQIFNHFNVKNMEEYESLSLIDSLFTADAVIDMLDTILKEYQK